MNKENLLSEISNSWKSLLELKPSEIHPNYIEPLLNTFFETVDKLLEKKKYKIVADLLSLFENNLKNNSNEWLKFHKVILQNVLKYKYTIYEIIYKIKNKESNKSNILWIELPLDKIFDILLQKSSFYEFMDEFKNSMLKHKDHRFWEYLFSLFYSRFSNLAPLQINENYFPSEFKISVENYRKDKNLFTIITNIVLKDITLKISKFLIYQDKSELPKLDFLFRIFFPDVYPDYFVKLIAVASFGEKEIILQKLIETPVVFPEFQVKIYWNDSEIKESKNKTFELAYILFRSTYTIQNLNNFIQTLNSISQSYQSNEYLYRINRLYRLFQEFIDWIESHKDDSYQS